MVDSWGDHLAVVATAYGNGGDNFAFFCQKTKESSSSPKTKNQIDLQKITMLQLQDVHFKLATICKPRFFIKVP